MSGKSEDRAGQESAAPTQEEKQPSAKRRGRYLTIGMLAVTQDEAWSVTTPRLPMKSNGSGDVTAALFAAHLAETGDHGVALGRTASSVFDLLENTLAAKAR